MFVIMHLNGHGFTQGEGDVEAPEFNQFNVVTQPVVNPVLSRVVKRIVSLTRGLNYEQAETEIPEPAR